MKVNILGSCVSRISMLDGDQSGHRIAHDDIEMGYFLDKQNIALSVMPPPFPETELLMLNKDFLWVNVLDKLDAYAPHDEIVIKYKENMNDYFVKVE